MLMRRFTLVTVLVAFALATAAAGCMAPKKRWGTDDRSGADAGRPGAARRA
jgi:hypothetical protein